MSGMRAPSDRSLCSDQSEKKSLQDYVHRKEIESAHLEAQVEALATNSDHDDTIAALRQQLDNAVASAAAAAQEAAERENSLCGELLGMKERETRAIADAAQGRAAAQADAEASVSAAVRIIAYEQALERAQRAEADARAQVEAAEALTAQAQGEVGAVHISLPFAHPS